MLLTKAIELFHDNLQVMERSKSTIYKYMLYLVGFNQYLCTVYNRQLYIDEIKPDDFERYVFNEYGKDKYADSTRHNIITAFKSLYSFCHRKEYCPINTGMLVKNIKVETEEREIINEVEFRRIVKNMSSPTAKAVASTLFYTGLRIAECLKLTTEEVDFNNGIIKVIKGKGKKDRNIPMNSRLRKILLNYYNHDRHEVGTNNFFSSKSGKMCRQYVNRELMNAIQKAGIQKKVTCHVLRHSFASNLVDKGANLLKVQKLLGHESIETTKIYLHTNLEELQDAVNLL